MAHRRLTVILISMALAMLGCAFSRRAAPTMPAPVVTNSASADQIAAFERAATYSEENGGVSMLVWLDGEIIYERYAEGSSADDAHNLYSGTKSFSCAIVVSAASEGLLTFDELVSVTIPEWTDDPQKSQITIRQLLSLSSGMKGGPVGRVPSYSDALDFEMVSDAGQSFHYGPVPYQVFGEIMTRKLGGETPLEYLKRKVFDPIGLSYVSWQGEADGEPHLPSGAHLTAREWLKYGELIVQQGGWNEQQVLDADLLSECFQGGEANSGYGMTFWLPMAEGGVISPSNADNGTLTDLPGSDMPTDLILAAGARGQRMYIMPSLGVIIVRQAEPPLGSGTQFVDTEFLTPMSGFFDSD